MFERFTARARRVIFFARYEASVSGSSEIASEHFLLALCLETALKEIVPVDSVRGRMTDPGIAARRTSTSTDLPLTQEMKRVLAHAADEAERLASNEINCSHLALGLFHEDRARATQWLREFGVTSDQVWTLLAAKEPSRAPASAATTAPPASMEATVSRLTRLVLYGLPLLQAVTEEQASRRIPSLGRTGAQALEQAIDQAILLRRWMENPDKNPAQAPKANWAELVELWNQENQRILSHASVMASTGETGPLPHLAAAYRIALEAILHGILDQE